MDFVASAVMQKDVKTVPPTMTLAQLEVCFVHDQVSGFAVVDDGKLVGVVSRSDVLHVLKPEYDITKLVYADESDDSEQVAQLSISKTLGERANKLTVLDMMTSDVVTITPNDPLHHVADLMYSKKIHRIFVVCDEELVGIITPFDFVRLYSLDRIGAEERPAPQREF